MIQALDIRSQIRSDNRMAANWLIHYCERKRDFENKKQEIIAGVKAKDENVGGGRSSLPGKPVENVVCRLEAYENGNTAKWLQTVEDVKSIVGPKKRQLLELRQECRYYIGPDGGRPGWIAPVQQRFGEITGWCPAESTLKDMWGSIVTLTVYVARLRMCKF